MKVFIVTGQTATGKTAHAQHLAGKYNGELVNFDSRQMYRLLDIITGKDIPPHSKFHLQEKRNTISIGFYPLAIARDKPFSTKIWLYDMVTPDQYFSSFDYVNCAFPVIESIMKRGKIPILVGGTYLYIKHLLYGIDENIPPDWKLREELKKTSVAELQTILSDINPESFPRLNNSERNNPQRLIRKIEIAKSTKGKTAGKKGRQENLLSHLKINMEDVEMIGFKYQKKSDVVKGIEKRVEKRISEGAIEEVKLLLEKGYDEEDPGLKTIGYREIIKYLKGSISRKKALEEWANREVQYAKRQLTFMKKDPHVKWKYV